MTPSPTRPASATVRVPATSANLGPGFDAMGLALAWYDEISVEPADGLRFDLTGEGSGTVPRDESHLVVRSLRSGLQLLGHPDPGLGLLLRAHGTIPHARGLGSSAAAIAAGLALAWGLTHPQLPLDREWLLGRLSLAEGHPDNAAAVVAGGAVLAWMDDERAGWVALPTDPRLRVVAWVPQWTLPTHEARQVLPDALSRAAVVAQASTAALLVHALEHAPHLLLRATGDWLHQDQRGPLMGGSHDLLTRLRHAGVPAVVSGAGPTILALGTDTELAGADDLVADDFVRHDLAIGSGLQLEVR